MTRCFSRLTGDSRLDASSEPLIAAAREALRNVARHAPGAPVNVFLDVDATRTEIFIREAGQLNLLAPAMPSIDDW